MPVATTHITAPHDNATSHFPIANHAARHTLAILDLCLPITAKCYAEIHGADEPGCAVRRKLAVRFDNLYATQAMHYRADGETTRHKSSPHGGRFGQHSSRRPAQHWRHAQRRVSVYLTRRLFQLSAAHVYALLAAEHLCNLMTVY